MSKKSLNSLEAVYSEKWKSELDGTEVAHRLRNFGRFHSTPGSISVHFDEIVPTIKEIASDANVAIGAVAWFTNRELLNALANLKRVAVVVQKEDFLRIDTEENCDEFRRRLRLQYDNLQPITNDDFLESYPGCQEGIPGLHHDIAPHLLGYKGLHVEGAVRTVGYQRKPNGNSTPVMHHKFMIFGNYRPDHIMYPLCVITGSFNWSHNAKNSRENIVVIYDKEVCGDFAAEWAQLWARSENLDWDSSQPDIQQHYIGT